MGFWVKCLPGWGPSEELWADTSAFGMCLHAGFAHQLMYAKKKKRKEKSRINLAPLIKMSYFQANSCTHKKKKNTPQVFADFPPFLLAQVYGCVFLIAVYWSSSHSHQFLWLTFRSVYESFKVLYLWLRLNSSSSLQS